MEQSSPPGVPRAPRIGVDPERLAGAGIDFSASQCHWARNGIETPASVVSIINISVGGIKIIVGGVLRDPKTDDKVVVSLVHSAGTWTLKGRVAWVQSITAEQWWLGIELNVSADALQVFRALTGESA